MSNEFNRNCFCCEKSLKSAFPGEVDSIANPPDDATHWRTKGNFGSTVIDCDGRELELYICDECLRAKAHFVYQFRFCYPRPEHTDVRPFDVSGDWERGVELL